MIIHSKIVYILNFSLASLKSCALFVFSDQLSWFVLVAVGAHWMNFWSRMIHAEVILIHFNFFFLIIKQCNYIMNFKIHQNCTTIKLFGQFPYSLKYAIMCM